MRACAAASIALLLAWVPSERAGAIPAPQHSHALADELARERRMWVSALEGKRVEESVALYAADADFLSQTRVHGAAAIRALYVTVTSMYDAECHLTSRSVTTSGNLAFDSGDYDETLTTRADGTKARHTGSYLTIYRRAREGRWVIVEQAWTEAPAAAAGR